MFKTSKETICLKWTFQYIVNKPKQKHGTSLVYLHVTITHIHVTRQMTSKLQATENIQSQLMKHIYNKIEKTDFTAEIVTMSLVMNKMFFMYLTLKIEKMFNFSCKLIS